MDQPIYKLKVSLRRIRPAIWRRIEVPADISLFDFHRTLQGAMGWSDSHLHQFFHRGTYYRAPDREFGMPTVSERRTRLSDLLQHPKDSLIYEYDFGDSWEHEVVLETIEEAQPGARYPRVIAGKRACPPEDVGGAPGYAEFVATITDPSHEEHASMLDWIGGRFDPEHFDVIATNDRVPKRRVFRRHGASIGARPAPVHHRERVMATVVGIAWYDPTEWTQLRAIAPDANNLENTHAQWLVLAEKNLDDLRAAGYEPHRIPIKLAELLAWCETLGRQPDASARAEYTSAELQRLHQSGLLDREQPER